jgi:hypothetical protein
MITRGIAEDFCTVVLVEVVVVGLGLAGVASRSDAELRPATTPPAKITVATTNAMVPRRNRGCCMPCV